MIMCNLQVYEAAAAAAAAQKVELLVYPEGYSLSGSPLKTGFFEKQVAKVGGTPCADADAATAPQQKALSCMAKNHGIAIATDLFTELANNSRRITEIVFDTQGVVVAVHDKINLFPIAEDIFEPGPFAATTFELFGRRWGTLICYEAAHAFLFRDFSQMQGMVDQGATAFVWSVGGMLPPVLYSRWMAERFHVAVVTSEGKTIASPAGAIVDASGKEIAHSSIPLVLQGSGYTAKAVVTLAQLPATNVIV